MKRFSILIVDSEENILTFLGSKFRTQGYDVFTSGDGPQGIELIQTVSPDLIIFDPNMVNMDGMEILKKMRDLTEAPIIILSANENAAQKVKCFQLGADDYLTKPFYPDELTWRIEAMKRRRLNWDQNITESFILGHITFKLQKHLIAVDGKEIPLTRIEWLLLSELAHNAGKLMFYHELLAKIWGPEYRDDIQILRTWISRLRKKLEQPDSQFPRMIRTVPKTGYLIDVSA